MEKYKGGNNVREEKFIAVLKITGSNFVEILR